MLFELNQLKSSLNEVLCFNDFHELVKFFISCARAALHN